MKIRWHLRSDPHPRDTGAEAACSFGARYHDLIFKQLNLQQGDCFLDAGCGPGEYALLAAERVGDSGSVIALDRDPFMLQLLQQTVEGRRIDNISLTLAELGMLLPLADDSVDSCLISTVLHMPGLNDRWDLLFSELQRILRPAGRLGIVESYPEDAAPERPLHLRLTPKTVISGVEPHGFKQRDLVDLGSSYLLCFENL